MMTSARPAHLPAPGGPPLSRRRLTVCVAGSGGVGKSSLTNKYLSGRFSELYDPTVEESHTTQVEYGLDYHDIEIFDTAGQEEFKMFRNVALSKGDAFLVLFAINSVSSWHAVREIRNTIVRENDSDETVPMVIIANKKDLESSRQVTFEETLEYCHQINCPLLETSAKTGLNVTESFRLLMDRMAELRPLLFEDSIVLHCNTDPNLSKPHKHGKCSLS